MENILYATRLDIKSKITEKDLSKTYANVTEVKNLSNEVLEMSFFVV